MSKTTEPTADSPRSDKRTGRLLARVLLLGLVPLVAILLGLYIYYTGGRYVSTENAYVRAEIIAISSDVDGRVSAVKVRNNQRVARGAELFRIDPEPFQLMVGEAQAQLQQARTSIETLRSDYREAMASIRTASQQVRYLKRRLNRQATLMKRGVITEEKLEDAAHELRVAEQQVTTLSHRARRALASLGGNVDIDYANHPTYQAARFRLEQARTRERQTVVRAPADGVVSNMLLQVGEYAEEGKAIFSLVNDNLTWVEANLKETQLTHLAPGQKATLSVDAYPDIQWPAVVSDIAPATGAEFALLPPQNATGNWVKVVQRVPVRLRIEPQSDAPRLRAGMTVIAEIDTQHQREWPLPFGEELGKWLKRSAPGR